MAGLINWKKVAIPGSNPDVDHVYVGIDIADNKFYAKDDAGNVVKFINAIDLNNHITDLANPHAVTKAQVGLGNVDNTSDLNKPISTATQSALDLKQNADPDLTAIGNLAGAGFAVRTTTNTWATRSLTTPPSSGLSITNQDGVFGSPAFTNTDKGSTAVSTHEASSDPHPQYETSAEAQAKVDAHATLTNNPHAVTKSQVGLGNADNTSDLNKPISTATQTALDLKYDASNPAGYITAAGAPVQSVNGETGILTNYAKTNINNNFSASQTITKSSGISSLEINSDDNESSVIFRAGSPENLWAIGADDFTNQFVITSTNGLSSSQEFNINTTTNTVDVNTKRILNVVNPTLAQDAATKAYVDAKVFGNNAQDFIDTTPFSSNSGTFVTAATWTTSALPAGRYRLNLQWNFTINSTTNSAFFNIRLDGVNCLSTDMQIEIKDTTDDIVYNAFCYADITGLTTHTLSLVQSTENFSTTTVNTARAEIWRVS